MLSGCAPQQTQKEARQLAEKRFSDQKARIKYSLALGQFENGQYYDRLCVVTVSLCRPSEKSHNGYYRGLLLIIDY